MSDLARRVLFAVAAVPIALGVIFLGSAYLATLLAVTAAIGAWELFRMSRGAGVTPLELPGICLAAAIPLVVHAHYLRVISPPLTVGVLVVLVLLAAAIWLRGVEGRPLLAVSVTIFGVLYTGGTLSYGYAIRYHDYAVGAAAGTALVLLPLILTWTSDIAAYFVGRAFGRRKLIPSVSPGKTVAGAVGGLFFTIVVCWLWVHGVLRPVGQLAMSPVAIILFGATISVVAQLGDLAESLLKREAGVKDSSRLIPGHGGVLDRFDSLFFVLPVSFFLLGHLLLPAPR